VWKLLEMMFFAKMMFLDAWNRWTAAQPPTLTLSASIIQWRGRLRQLCQGARAGKDDVVLLKKIGDVT
jgi:hypothetical protein